MDLEKLKLRIERGEQYLLALEEFRDRAWRDVFAEYRSGRLALPQALVLVHPDFYAEREAEVGMSIRGPRSFSTTAGQHAAGCMADRIWLSACRLRAGSDVQADHLFPYALGGPTLAANQLFLCRAHNGAKGSDVHLFPWEQGEPDWLPTQVERIGRLLL